MKPEELFENAKWIKPSSGCCNAIFRSEFEADSSDKTEITICGLGFFRLYINGRKVSDDELAPVTSYYHDREKCYCRDQFGEKMRSRIYAEKYDISGFIRTGINKITVTTGIGWYYEFGSSPVLIYLIENGSNITVSDESVQWAAGPVTETIFHRYEYQDYTSACYDKLTCAPDTGWQNCIKAHIPETEYYLNNCPNDKIIRSITPVIIKETEEYSVYDIGENITGVYVFECDEKGIKIEVTCAEESENNDIKEKYIQRQISTFVTDGSDREYRLQFTWAACRYIRISKPAKIKRFDVIHTAVDRISDFSSDNKVLGWIYESFIRTQLANMHAGIPSDCPHLERRGYTGDGQLVSETGMLTLDTKEFYLKWMEDISDCQDEISGHVQYTAPYAYCGGGPGGWGCAIAVVPYNFYKISGDIGPMKKYYGQALHYLDYLESHSENDLVISDQPGLWCLGDWCAPHEVHGKKPDIPEPFVNNYFYIKTIDILTEMADITGNGDKKDYLSSVRERKVKAIIDNYYDEKTGVFADNFNGANAFALDIGLGDERTLKEFIRNVREETPDYGIFGIEICIGVLCRKGYIEDAINLLSREEYPSYGFMMQSGATTLWEEWKNARSDSHPMFGAVVKYLFYYVLGIRMPETGNISRYEISPFVNKITGNVRGYVMTPAGRIEISTDIDKNQYCVTIPDGIEARCRNGSGSVIKGKAGSYIFGF